MKIPLWLKTIITIVLVYLIFKMIGSDKIINAISKVDVQYLLAALLLSPLIIVFGTEKWYQMTKKASDSLERKDACISFLGGMSLGLLTPGRIGEFSRVLFLRGSKIELTGIAIVDKVIDVEVVLLIALYATAILFGTWAFLLTFMFTFLGIIFLYFPHKSTFLLTKIIHFRFIPFKKKLDLLIQGINSTPHKTISLCILYRLLMTVIDVIQFYLLIMAFIPTKVIYALIAYPLVMLTNILPITIGGIGVRESVSALILTKFNIPPECAVSASFLLFCVNTLLPGLIGSLFISRIKLTNTVGVQLKANKNLF